MESEIDRVKREIEDVTADVKASVIVRCFFLAIDLYMNDQFVKSYRSPRLRG